MSVLPGTLFVSHFVPQQEVVIVVDPSKYLLCLRIYNNEIFSRPINFMSTLIQYLTISFHKQLGISQPLSSTDLI